MPCSEHPRKGGRRLAGPHAQKYRPAERGAGSIREMSGEGLTAHIIPKGRPVQKSVETRHRIVPRAGSVCRQRTPEPLRSCARANSRSRNGNNLVHGITRPVRAEREACEFISGPGQEGETGLLHGALAGKEAHCREAEKKWRMCAVCLCSDASEAHLRSQKRHCAKYMFHAATGRSGGHVGLLWIKLNDDSKINCELQCAAAIERP